MSWLGAVRRGSGGGRGLVLLCLAAMCFVVFLCLAAVCLCSSADIGERVRRRWLCHREETFCKRNNHNHVQELNNQINQYLSKSLIEYTLLGEL
jgi:hypothetical protein